MPESLNDDFSEIIADLINRGVNQSVIEAFEEYYKAGKFDKAWRILEKTICAARRKRDGKACLAAPINGTKRCKLHGGASSGPKSLEGRSRIAAAQRLRWQRWRILAENTVAV